jgi:hypothetical protein
MYRSCLQFIEDDGGRRKAGYKGKADDCVVRAIAIATKIPYKEVYRGINTVAKRENANSRRRYRSNARTGVYRDTYTKYLSSLGWKWTPTMGIGSGCKVHLHPDELPSGRLVLSLSKHMAAFIDGVLHDAEDTSRGGRRCVYGYWRRG